MEFNKVVESRQSIRSFQRKKIPRRVITKVVTAATKAPSACNRQPWIFYCVDNKEKRNKIANLVKVTFESLIENSKKSEKSQNTSRKFYEDLGGAQNIIFIYRTKDTNEATHVRPNDFKSISCAAENLMLEAVNLSLGTCWIGLLDGKVSQDKLQKIIKNNKNEELVASIIIGYPSKNNILKKRYKKKLSEVIKFV